MSERDTASARLRHDQRDEIKQLLQARIDSLCRELLPDGHRSGRYWIGARNPSRADTHAGSFYVWLTGVPGAWRDDASGQKGDVFQLIALVEGCDFKAAMQWARAWLGLDGLSPPERKKRAVEAQKIADTNTAEEAERREKAARRAMAVFLESKYLDGPKKIPRPFLGSPADLYLQGRGIDVERLGRLPGVLGWLPDNMHHESAKSWPVMVAGFTHGETGKICAVHRTFISCGFRGSPAGPVPIWTKAPVHPVRKIWPSYSGAAIRIWRGASKLSEKDAAAQGLLETLVLCEGVEDGLSVALSCPEHRVWCAGSLGNLAEIKLPACCDRVIVCADNDWGKPQAAKLLERAIDALSRQGAHVSVARSHVGKDVNDCLRGAQSEERGAA